MSTIKRTFNHVGEKVSVELNLPTNQEHNDYRAAWMKLDDVSEVVKCRASFFDRLLVSSTKPKEEIYDAAKATVVAQLFDIFLIDEKN